MNDRSESGSEEERPVYETRWQDFYYDDIVHPTGESGQYSWIKSHSGNGAVMIVPVTPSERYLLVSVYRHPIKRNLWEFTAGGIEADESPLACASRELFEETGIASTETAHLGTHVPIGPLVGESYHSVLARIPEIDVISVTPQIDEGITDAKLVNKSEIFEMIVRQEIEEGVTLANLARYWAYQHSQEQA